MIGAFAVGQLVFGMIAGLSDRMAPIGRRIRTGRLSLLSRPTEVIAPGV